MAKDHYEGDFMSGAGAEANASLLKAALALRDARETGDIPRLIRPAFEALPHIRAAGAGINDENRRTYRRYYLDFDEGAVATRAAETPAEESEARLLGDPARTFVSPPLTAGSESAVLGTFPCKDIERYVCAPLLIQGKLIGGLFAAFSADPPVSDVHVKHLEALAHIAAPAVWCCITNERFKHGDRRRDALVALSAAINAAADEGAVLAAAKAAVDSLADRAGCSVDLIEGEGERYRVHLAGGAAHPLRGVAEEERVFSLGGTALEWAVERQRTYKSDDLKESTRFQMDAGLREAGIRRYTAAPMIAHGAVIGALFMASTEGSPIPAIDVWLYENMALQIGLAIANARQVRRLRELSEKLSQENVLLREERRRVLESQEMVGRSAAMDGVRAAIERVAGMDSTVLITGRTGVGKELVAHAIHAASARADQALIKINCAAIPETMVESELFGHERGAFTSAVDRRIGRFELAHEGTLFLDEIGELSAAVQAKLLRVLQDGEFERVGGSKTIKSNARIIAATNRDLLKSVEAGAFRGDLYYRLNVFPIHVPALEQRREDIPLLVQAFINEFGRRMGKQIDSVDPGSLECLIRRPWPGNIRELRHVIERAMILCDGRSLHVECGQHAAGGGNAPAAIVGESSRASLAEVEAEHIRRVLGATNFVIEGPMGAAAVLGLKPSTLRSRMKRLGIGRG